MVSMPVIKLSGRPKLQKSFYFCIADSGYSAVRLAHLVWDQRAASSNLATPTTEDQRVAEFCSSLFLYHLHMICIQPGHILLSEVQLLITFYATHF